MKRTKLLNRNGINGLDIMKNSFSLKNTQYDWGMSVAKSNKTSDALGDPSELYQRVLNEGAAFRWPAFCMGQYRVNDHPYRAPQFTQL